MHHSNEGCTIIAIIITCHSGSSFWFGGSSFWLGSSSFWLDSGSKRCPITFCFSYFWIIKFEGILGLIVLSKMKKWELRMNRFENSVTRTRIKIRSPYFWVSLRIKIFGSVSGYESPKSPYFWRISKKYWKIPLILLKMWHFRPKNFFKKIYFPKRTFFCQRFYKYESFFFKKWGIFLKILSIFFYFENINA